MYMVKHVTSPSQRSTACGCCHITATESFASQNHIFLQEKRNERFLPEKGVVLRLLTAVVVGPTCLLLLLLLLLLVVLLVVVVG